MWPFTGVIQAHNCIDHRSCIVGFGMLSLGVCDRIGTAKTISVRNSVSKVSIVSRYWRKLLCTLYCHRCEYLTDNELSQTVRPRIYSTALSGFVLVSRLVQNGLFI